MFVQRFYERRLAQASYLIGCVATGEALVVDANRDLEPYLRAAADEGLRITHVSETHIHADYISGSRELARHTGAQLFLSAEGGPDWQYAFAEDAGATLVRDGDVFEVGNIRVVVMHTPGHTPEHISFLITDTAATDRPIAALTGDFVFVGDVGRPDLLEKAARIEGTMEAGARTLYASLRRFLGEQPDDLQIWPAHGAGSACGKGLAAIPTSTVGYERATNWAFGIDVEDAFVDEVLADQPEPPLYFAKMKELNKVGPRLLGGFRRPRRIGAPELADLLAARAQVVDLRDKQRYAAGHLPHTINLMIAYGGFTTWAGWLLEYERPITLIGSPEQVDEAVKALAMIGLDDVAGAYFGALDDPALPAQVPLERATVDELPALLASGARLLDIRGRKEHADGHIPGATLIPGGELRARADELGDRGTPVVLYCRSGERSAMVASELQRLGFARPIDLIGGIGAWRAAGHTPVTEPPLVAVS